MSSDLKHKSDHTTSLSNYDAYPVIEVDGGLAVEDEELKAKFG